MMEFRGNVTGIMFEEFKKAKQKFRLNKVLFTPSTAFMVYLIFIAEDLSIYK